MRRPCSRTARKSTERFRRWPARRRIGQTTVRRLRPFLRRAARTLRPPRVALRARKPILRARFLRCGRNVGFIDLWQKEGQIRARGGGVSSERFKGRFAPKTGGRKAGGEVWKGK